MSQIVTEVYDAFRAANVHDELARAAAGAIAGREDLVTKLDLERDVNRVQADIGGLKAEVATVKADLRGLKTEVGGLKTEVGGLKAEVGGVKAEVGDLKADMKLLKFGYGPAILGLLIKLVFFP